MPVVSRPSTLCLPEMLVLRSAKESDQGRYTCIANNSAGEDRMDSELFVRREYSDCFIHILPNDTLGRRTQAEVTKHKR